MKTRNSTKSKLLSSVIALVLCVSMLIGATFAWFTDTASTAVNKIQAGNLDIQLLAEDGSSLEGKTLSWQKADGNTGESVLWEPGCTYFTDGFQIKNAGDLNLKFKIAVNGITGGDATLLNAIDFYLTTTKSNDLSSTGAIPLNSFTSGEFKLAPGQFWKGTTDSDDTSSTPMTIYLAGHMKEDAGNEYQGLTIDGIGITVYATQMEAEFDSFNNSYDHDADYIERHATIMGDDGKTITLEKGKTYTVGNGKVKVDANGDITYTNAGAAQTVTIQTDGGTLTVNAPNDTVNHYGEANFVNVTAVAGNSYHEFGKVAVLSLAKGRVVVENGDNIGVIQVPSAATTPVIAVPENVVLDTKIEKANTTTSVKIDVIDSQGTAIAGKSFATTNGQTTAEDPAIPEELKIVLKTDASTIAEQITDYEASIGNKPYVKLGDAVTAAQSGDTVTLLKDVAYATNSNDLFDITKSITLDGNGHKITGYGNRSGNNTTLAINNSGTDMVSVELKNLTIDNAGTNGRAVETRGNIKSLKITNCKFNCTGSGNTQVLTIGGSQSSAANVTINQSALSAGKAGYPIITFNPIKLKIENESVLSGFCGIYFKGVSGSEGSHGSTVTAENSEFDCPNVHSGEGSNDFGVFSLEDDNINITVTNCKINAQAQGTARQAILMTSSYAHRTNDGFSITIAGDSFVNGNLLSMSDSWVNGYTYSITGGSFTDLVSALKYAASGATIGLAQDAQGGGLGSADGEKVRENLTIDFNGHTYTVVNNAVGSPGTKSQAMHWGTSLGAITLKNGTFKVASGADNVKMAMQNYINFTAENMNFDFSAIPVSHYGEYTGENAVYNHLEVPMFNANGAPITMKNCTVKMPADSNKGIYAEEATITLTNCNIDGYVCCADTIAKVINTNSTWKGFVSYFDKYVPTNNGNEYYVVLSTSEAE